MNQQVERSASQEQSVSSMNQQIERSASLPSMKSMASMTIVPNPGHKGASAKHGTHPAPLLLDRIPSLSGDPFDAFDDFADLHSRHHAQMTPLMSPVTPASSQPFCATPSSTTISSVDTWTVRQQSINASPCTSINASPCTPVESLHAHIQTLRSLSSARRMARALKNLHDMRRDIPGAALVSTDLIPSVCNALSAFVSSSAVCEQACRFLSEIAQRGPKARRIALGYSALQLANDAISNHFGLYPSTVQWALHAIGSLCANGSSMITHTLLSNRTFHWILVSMRQWRDVPLIQTYAFRALSTAIQTDFENAFHLVLSHAFFHELNEALENFAHDPFLVADAFEILLLFICPSAEFRRLSFCEGVLEAVVEAFLPHAAVCRVAAAFARIVSVFCVDACSRVVVVRSGAVHALLCALEHVRVPGPRHSIPKVVPHRIGRLSAPSPRVGITDADCCEDECRSLSMPDAWARSPTSTTDVMVSVLQALLATCVGCTQGCDQILHRRWIFVIAKATSLHADDPNLMECTLELFVQLLNAGAEVDRAPFAFFGQRRILSSLRDGRARSLDRSLRSGVFDEIIRLSVTSLYGHWTHATVVRPALVLLLHCCQRGFRSLVVKHGLNVSSAIKQVLHTHDDNAVLRPACALLMQLV